MNSVDKLFVEKMISEITSTLPMLAVPGWSDIHRLPNAAPVASALNSTARARLDPLRVQDFVHICAFPPLTGTCRSI